jgi:hypothetical protein
MSGWYLEIGHGLLLPIPYTPFMMISVSAVKYIGHYLP